MKSKANVTAKTWRTVLVITVIVFASSLIGGLTDGARGAAAGGAFGAVLSFWVNRKHNSA